MTRRVVNWVNIRTNQTQSSEIRPNLRTKQKPWSSDRPRSELCSDSKCKSVIHLFSGKVPYSSPMSQIMEIVSQSSPTKNLGESSDTQALHAHFCPKIHPIYQIRGKYHYRSCYYCWSLGVSYLDKTVANRKVKTLQLSGSYTLSVRQEPLKEGG
jgi:hypothetical protein